MRQPKDLSIAAITWKAAEVLDSDERQALMGVVFANMKREIAEVMAKAAQALADQAIADRSSTSTPEV